MQNLAKAKDIFRLHLRCGKGNIFLPLRGRLQGDDNFLIKAAEVEFRSDLIRRYLHWNVCRQLFVPQIQSERFQRGQNWLHHVAHRVGFHRAVVIDEDDSAAGPGNLVI